MFSSTRQPEAMNSASSGVAPLRIAVARARFGEHGRFFAEPYTDAHRRELAPFDKVLLLGLLHHLGDADARGRG